jgi:hypothetical protein
MPRRSAVPPPRTCRTPLCDEQVPAYARYCPSCRWAARHGQKWGGGIALVAVLVARVLFELGKLVLR